MRRHLQCVGPYVALVLLALLDAAATQKVNAIYYGAGYGEPDR